MDGFEKGKSGHLQDNSTAPMLSERSYGGFPYSFQNPNLPPAYGFSMQEPPSHHPGLYDQSNLSLHPALSKVNQRHVDHGDPSALQPASRSESLPYKTYPHLIPCSFATTNVYRKACSPSNVSKNSFTHTPNKQSSFFETTSNTIHMMVESRQHHQEQRIQHQVPGTNHYNQRSVESCEQTHQKYEENALYKKQFNSQNNQQKIGDKVHHLETMQNGLSFCSTSSNNVNHSGEIRTGMKDICSKLASQNAYFKCGICELKLSSNEALLGHINTHTDFMPYSCNLCGVSFVESRQLIRHVQHSHSVKPPYACGLCNQNFHENLDLEQHVLSHSKEKIKADSDLQVAPFVDKADSGHLTSDAANLDTKEDDSEVENDKEAEDDCSDDCHSSGAANTIIISKDTRFDVRKEPSKIVMNDVDFESVCTVIIEPSSAGGIRKKHLFKCNFCEKICKDKGSLVSHVRTHTKGRPYECHICSATFKQYAHLSDHMITKHSKDRAYVCDRCAKSFNRKSHLQDHIRLKHTEDKLYHCTECPLTFEKSSDFSEHKRTHGKKHKHQCYLCPRQFRNVTDYERHVRSHTKEKPFECEICHLKFGLLANAKKHMIKHNNEKPFKCDICPKAYHFAHDFKRHSVTHLKKKPFPCSECYKSFKNSVLLKKHMNTAHIKAQPNTQVPFQCIICGKHFKTQLKLDIHSKAHEQTDFSCNSVTEVIPVNHSKSEIKKSPAKDSDSNLQTDLAFIACGEGNENQEPEKCTF